MDLYPIWAPDGSKIYFSRLTPDSATASWRGEIYSVNPNGTGLTKVSNDAGSLYFPSVSPDGKKIAVVRLPLGAAWDQARLYTMNPDGTDRKYIVMWQGQQANPTFSRDGTRIVFESYATGNGKLFSVKPDGTGSMQLIPLDRNAYYSAAWSR